MDARTSFLALSVCVLGALAALIVLPLVEYVLAACLLAVVLRPLYERLAPRVGARTAGLTATGLAVVGGVVPLVLVSLVVLRTAASVRETTSIDRIAANVGEFARTELGLADGTVAALESAVSAELEGTIASAADVTLARTVGLVTTAADVVVGTIVLVFVLYYLLVDGPAAVDWIRRHVPLERRVLDDLFEEVHVVVWAVLRSHVLVAVVQGILGGLGLALLGVPYAPVLAVVLVLVSFLPTIGVWLVWGPVTIAHAASSGPVRGVLLLGYGIAVLTVVDNYLRAILVDRRAHLHPAIVLVGAIGGVFLFGIIGVFVGPVVLATFKVCVTAVDRIDRTTPDADADAESELEEERLLADTKR